MEGEAAVQRQRGGMHKVSPSVSVCGGKIGFVKTNKIKNNELFLHFRDLVPIHRTLIHDIA